MTARAARSCGKILGEHVLYFKGGLPAAREPLPPAVRALPLRSLRGRAGLGYRRLKHLVVQVDDLDARPLPDVWYLCRGVPPMKLCRARGWALTEDVRWWGHPAATAPNPRNTQFGKVHRVTASVGLWAVAATHRPPQRMWRFGWRRRVPMLYGTRRGSRPALLPRVCGVTCEYGTKLWSLDGLEERGEGDSGLRAARPDDGRDNRSPRPGVCACFVAAMIGSGAAMGQAESWQGTDPRERHA
jgi:hypothetical protein